MKILSKPNAMAIYSPVNAVQSC